MKLNYSANHVLHCREELGDSGTPAALPQSRSQHTQMAAPPTAFFSTGAAGDHTDPKKTRRWMPRRRPGRRTSASDGRLPTRCRTRPASSARAFATSSACGHEESQAQGTRVGQSTQYQSRAGRTWGAVFSARSHSLVQPNLRDRVRSVRAAHRRGTKKREEARKKREDDLLEGCNFVTMDARSTLSAFAAASSGRRHSGRLLGPGHRVSLRKSHGIAHQRLARSEVGRNL